MSTMTISSIIATEKQSSNTSKAPTSTVFISSNVCAPSLNSGATVFVHDSTTIHDSGIPDVQSANNEHKSDFGEESSHVLKINITPATNLDKVMSSECYNQESQKSEDSCIRISVVTNPGPDPIKDGRKNVIIRAGKDYSPISTNIRSCFYYQNPLIASGQCSPSETLDSGTCSDLDSASLPLPMKKNASTVLLGNSQHTRTGSLTSSGAEVDSDDNESNVSCDSLNNADLSKSDNEINDNDDCKLIRNDQTVAEISSTFKGINLNKIAQLASVNREDAKTRGANNEQVTTIVNECSYEERKREKLERKSSPGERATELNGSGRYTYENDRFYKFHLNECRNDPESSQEDEKFDEECFAGFKILEREAIRSAKGTVRGVKNRVRAGIATFLQKPSTKDFRLKDAGKVVVYTTTMGIVRETYYACMKVKQILRTHLIKYEERDLYMSVEYQAELKDRINSTVIDVPQLFIDGQLIGDVNTVDRLNESGDLRLMLKPYQSSMVYNTCTHCGGFRLYPCPVCNGSKKSVHRNDFTAEFVALKCMNCDEVGLVRCNNC